jgi:O-antigen biosynthesis alpha-1,2-mannosyltransferase
LTIALDATYSLGEHLTGVGVYSRRLLEGLARAHPAERFLWCYRPHVFLRSFRDAVPPNCHRRPLLESRGPHGMHLFHGLNQRLPRTRRLRRAIATFHDLFVLTGEYSTPGFRQRFAEQARHAARAADAIIAVSQFTATQVEQLLGVEPSRIHVIHHGAPEPNREPEPAVREPIILHVGAIQRRKNISRLVRAFEGTDPRWRLVLAGSAGYGAEEILQQIEASPCRARIELAGYVDAAKLARWYSRAAIFAFPSLDEGFGMPVLEAMAAGVPVLTSNRSALPEVAGDAALLVNPEDGDALAAALKMLTEDEELRNSLTARGFTQARKFSWHQATSETWKVYDTYA